jgi:hypothetical protein
MSHNSKCLQLLVRIVEMIYIISLFQELPYNNVNIIECHGQFHNNNYNNNNNNTGF